MDKCFVDGVVEGDENAAIVRAILATAYSLGIRATAEGVETLEQVRAFDSDGF